MLSFFIGPRRTLQCCDARRPAHPRGHPPGWFGRYPGFEALRSMFADLLGGMMWPLARKELLEVRKMAASRAEDWKREWLQVGKQKGEQEGELIGALVGSLAGPAVARRLTSRRRRPTTARLKKQRSGHRIATNLV